MYGDAFFHDTVFTVYLSNINIVVLVHMEVVLLPSFILWYLTSVIQMGLLKIEGLYCHCVYVYVNL